MNIFSTLKVYGGWKVVEERSFTSEEISVIAEAEVVPSDYGMSAKFTLTDGNRTYIPMSRDSTLEVGDPIDMTEAKLLTLEKSGSNNIIRVKA